MAEFVMSALIVFIVLTLILFTLWLTAMKKLKNISEDFGQLRHDHRSIFVKHGKAWENFVPFMPDFTKIADKDNTVFLGMPVDLISFDDDAIKFIEVKTGKAKLSHNQQRIKKLIMEKKVEWHELRFGKD